QRHQTPVDGHDLPPLLEPACHPCAGDLSAAAGAAQERPTARVRSAEGRPPVRLRGVSEAGGKVTDGHRGPTQTGWPRLAGIAARPAARERPAMSESALPEDVSKWPEDPYELFGVPHTVTPRDLKRAYTRLIRTYKPEQFPEQFRRIRAAYETILRFAELF